jgi:formylglycine-generating enzyme required for sulfatase activity
VLDATPGAKTGYPRRVRDERSGIVFLLVEPGEFRMGSTRGNADEQPVHTVRITKPFYLAETETTQQQWEAVMGTNPSNFRGPRLPVETVSWNDLQAFVRNLNGGGAGPFRLPTEAEWEYACRAGTNSEYAFGDVISTNQANYDVHNRTVAVGSFKPNAWGFYDMHGNVWEWCSDWYDSDYYATCRDGVSDPQGPSDGVLRVVRGGSWNTYPAYVRSANRSMESVDDAYLCGCRVSRTL